MLRLSRETDYGLLALVYMARRPSAGPADRGEIAAHYGIPKEFLAKVLQKLARAGLIRSYRGTQGGYRLARTADNITVADVIEVLEGPVALAECGCGPDSCREEPACEVRAAMQEIQEEIRGVFSGVTLRQIGHRISPGGDRRRIAEEATPR